MASSSNTANESKTPVGNPQEFVNYFGKDAKQVEVLPPLDFFASDATPRMSISSSRTGRNSLHSTGAKIKKLQTSSLPPSTDAFSTASPTGSFDFSVPGTSENKVKESIFQTSSADSHQREFSTIPEDKGCETIVAGFLEKEKRNEASTFLPVVDNKGCEDCRSWHTSYHKLKSLYENFLRGNPQARVILEEVKVTGHADLRNEYHILLKKYNDLVDECHEVQPALEQMKADREMAQATIRNMTTDLSPQEVEELKNENAKLADQLKAADDNYKYLENQARTVQRELDETRSMLADEEARYKATRDDLTATHEELENETRQIRKAEITAQKAHKEVARLEVDLKKAKQEAVRLQEALDRRDKEITDHNLNNKGILTQLSDARLKISAFKEEVKILNATVKNYEKAEKELVVEKAINETLKEQMDNMKADTGNRFNLDPMAYQPAEMPTIKESSNPQASSLADELDLDSPMKSQSPSETQSEASEQSSQADDSEAAEASPVARQLEDPFVFVAGKDRKEDKAVAFVPTPLNETFEVEKAPAEDSHPNESATCDDSPPLSPTRIVYVSKPTETLYTHSPFNCWKVVNIEFFTLLGVFAFEAWKAITPLLRIIFGNEFPSPPHTPDLPIQSTSIGAISDGDRTITPRSYRRRRPALKMMMMKPPTLKARRVPLNRPKPTTSNVGRRLSSSSASGCELEVDVYEAVRSAAQDDERANNPEFPHLPPGPAIDRSGTPFSVDGDGLPAPGEYYGEGEELNLRYSSEAIKTRWKSTVFNFAVEVVFFYFVYLCYNIYSERRVWLQANDATRSLLLQYIDLYSDRCSKNYHSWATALLSPRWARVLDMRLLNVAELFRYQVRSFKMAG